MDTEMIERVAWSIVKQLHWNVPVQDQPLSWSDLDEKQAELIKTAAINAIKAMREPTQEMLAFRIMSDAEKDSLKADYQAMIDHIIGE